MTTRAEVEEAISYLNELSSGPAAKALPAEVDTIVDELRRALAEIDALRKLIAESPHASVAVATYAGSVVCVGDCLRCKADRGELP